jgi:hypothetical protein
VGGGYLQERLTSGHGEGDAVYVRNCTHIVVSDARGRFRGRAASLS